ncbi:hypothetical protein AQJ46_19980 [Streptomyces canus]|uniref:Uncharacterized protein n=1 Tax=Streptomyces canus TaxID=58343 RepID=A0A101S835_9ACTN|nr:hypothetical protein AQJ46_19980 [Streptomyces canus]
MLSLLATADFTDAQRGAALSLAENMQHAGFQPCLVVVPGDRQRFRPVPKFAQSAPRYAVCDEDAQGGGLSAERRQFREGTSGAEKCLIHLALMSLSAIPPDAVPLCGSSKAGAYRGPVRCR